MGGLRYLTVILEDNPSGVYFAGGFVKGKISFGLGGDGKKARGVRVEMKGQANVAFTKRKGSGKNRRTRYYADSETYVKEVTYVMGDESSEMQIAAGEYEFPFQFQLPQNIPSSFKGEHGRVAYSVTGVIDRPWKFDHETVTFFSVICNYDLNLAGRKELAEAPQSVSDEKFICCWCCKSGPISASGQMDRTGYVPGENITVKVMADNKSTVLVEPLRVMLVQTQTFKADKLFGIETKESTSVICMVESEEPLEPGDSESYPDIVFKIPALPPSGLEHCTKIDVDYTIQIDLPPKGCHMTLQIHIPLIIGTIPLQSAALNLNEVTPSGNVWLNKTQGALLKKEGGAYEMKALLSTEKDDDASREPQPNAVRPSAPPIQNLYPDLPLPTYEEAMDMPHGEEGSMTTMRMDGDNEHATGNWDFKPIYPYYG